MQKAQFNKATGAYDKRSAPAQAGDDAAKAGAPAPAASSERTAQGGNAHSPAPVDEDDKH